MSYGFYSLVNDDSLVTVSADAQAQSAKFAMMPWPASYREPFVPILHQAYQLELKAEVTGQLSEQSKYFSWDELLKSAATTEMQKIHSKSGWMYQGLWTTIGFQRLFAKLQGVEQFHGCQLKTLGGKTYTIPKSRLGQYRLVLKCEDKLLPALYGGPVMVHCFDNYVEYAIEQVAEVTLCLKEESLHLPNEENGFSVTAMRAQTGNYYLINKEQVKHIRY